MALDKKNLLVRSLSGACYIGLIIGCIVLGTVAMAILMSLFALIGSYELEKNALGRSAGDRWLFTWAIDAAALVCLIWSCIHTLPMEGVSAMGFWIVLIFIRFLVQIFINQPDPLKSIATGIFVQLYIGLPLLLLCICTALSPNPWLVVCFISMIWINDTGAYLVGCTMGRHKMSPSISPKKSWEGLAGGLLFNIGAAFIFYYCFDLKFPVLLDNVSGWVFIGICVSVFATLGDLFESMIKRAYKIKDFGNIIPGHGGILDRIDSLLFVVPGVLFMCWMGVAMFL